MQQLATFPGRTEHRPYSFASLSFDSFALHYSLETSISHPCYGHYDTTPRAICQVAICTKFLPVTGELVTNVGCVAPLNSERDTSRGVPLVLGL